MERTIEVDGFCRLMKVRSCHLPKVAYNKRFAMGISVQVVGCPFEFSLGGYI